MKKRRFALQRVLQGPGEPPNWLQGTWTRRCVGLKSPLIPMSLSVWSAPTMRAFTEYHRISP